MRLVVIFLLITCSMMIGAAPFVRVHWWAGKPHIFREAVRVHPNDVVLIETDFDETVLGQLVGYSPEDGYAKLILDDGTSLWAPIQCTREILYL